MKDICLVLLFGSLGIASAQVPPLISHQGRVSVGGTNFTGTGQFRFALVDGTGTTTYWSNGVNNVALTVTKGLYSVLLGDTTIPNMAALSAAVFTNSDVRLRVWFDDGISGLQQLSPDQRLVAAGYALQADRAYQAAAADIAQYALVASLAHSVLATNGSVTTESLVLQSNTSAWTLSNSSNEFAIGYSEVEPSKAKAPEAKSFGLPTWLVRMVLDTGTWIFKHSGIIRADGFKCDGDMSVEGTLRVGLNHMASGTGSAVVGGSNNTAAASGSFVGGGCFNSAGGDGSFVGGGANNVANGTAAFIAGGANNSAGGDISFIGAGHDNNAPAGIATIAGGEHNTAGGVFSAIGGGSYNVASGRGAVVPGGEQNYATTNYTFAAGRKAYATHEGAFVWSSSPGGSDPTYSYGNYTFTVRSHGGVRFYTASGTGTGVYLNSMEGTWYSLCDRNAKENFQPVNCREILQKLLAVPISKWNYKNQPSRIPHIGPVAQDFAAAFGVGENDHSISTVDADGVALAAIKGLNEKFEEVVKEKDARIAALEKRLAELERQLARGGK